MEASAYAAWAAAMTSLATLVVTTMVGGRREHRKWAREALTDAFVAFLEASWSHSDAAKANLADLAAGTQELNRQYTEMRSQLTRLRLLASREVLAASEELLRLQRDIQDAGTVEERRAALGLASQGRHRVVVEAKKVMGLA